MNNNDIKVYIKKVDENYIDSHFDELLLQVYTERREKVLKYKSKKVAGISLTAGLLMQEVIGKDLGLNVCDIHMGTETKGKPFLIGHEDYHFNLSHSGEYVVFAVAKTDVGVDIERVGGKYNARVAERCFTEREQEYVLAVDSEMERRFCELWTMKESYLKVSGVGISLPLNSFEINVEKLLVEHTEYSYSMKQMEDYIISVCCKNIGNVEYEVV